MFGRTGAPQKGAPQKERQFFACWKNWRPPSETRVMSKKGRNGKSTADARTVMAKKGRQFFSGKIGSATPVEGPPHFFLNRALLRVNQALLQSPLQIQHLWLSVKLSTVLQCIYALDYEVSERLYCTCK